MVPGAVLPILGRAQVTEANYKNETPQQTHARWAWEHIKANPGIQFRPEYVQLAEQHAPLEAPTVRQGFIWPSKKQEHSHGT